MAKGDVLLRVNGDETAYRCSCGSNVFHRVVKADLEAEGRDIHLTIYECNGCGDWYRGKPKEEEK